MARRADTQARRASRLPHAGSNNLRTLADRASHVCHLCGNKVFPSEGSRDHILPVSAGGMDNHRNYAYGHKQCNTARGDLPLGLAQEALTDWREQHPGIYLTTAIACVVLSLRLKQWREQRYRELGWPTDGSLTQ